MYMYILYTYNLGCSLFFIIINVVSRARHFVWYTNKIILVKLEYDKSNPSRTSKGLEFYEME